MAVVAYSNSLTSVLLLRAAGLTGHDTYEGVAYAIGGKYWKVRAFLSHIVASGLRHLDSHLMREATQRTPTTLCPI